ncbi:MAG: hypothetical protein ACREQ5_22900, partial [Candidatus Dormibacteria bacterium]
MISFAEYGNNFQDLTATPLTQKQAGFFAGWGTNHYRVFGQLDDSRRQFLSFARYPNGAPTLPANWSATSNGTVTPGVSAPDGTTNAAHVTSSSGTAGAVFFRKNITFAVGDWFIWGGWVRGTSAGPVQFPINLYLLTTGFSFAGVAGAAGVGAGSFIQGDGEWEFVVNWGKVTAIGTNPCDTELLGNTDPTHPCDFYYPVYLHIATGTISDNEVAAIATALVSQRSDAGAGFVSVPAGVPFMLDMAKMTKQTALAVAPGADIAHLQFEAGTNAGTLKLVAYAGTSTTGVTVADNIGTGN